jgi:hypothetical protein
MKIAMTHVDLPNESKGGVAFQAHYLANILVERGHDVTMFTFSPVYPDCRYSVHQYPISPQLRRLQAFVFAVHLAKTIFLGLILSILMGTTICFGDTILKSALFMVRPKTKPSQHSGCAVASTRW